VLLRVMEGSIKRLAQAICSGVRPDSAHGYSFYLGLFKRLFILINLNLKIEGDERTSVSHMHVFTNRTPRAKS
jgi:hypothetical protein